MIKSLFLFFILVPVFSFSKYECNFINHIINKYPISFSIKREDFKEKEIELIKKSMDLWNKLLGEKVLIRDNESKNIIKKRYMSASENRVAEAYHNSRKGVIEINFDNGQEYEFDYFYKVSIHEFGHALGLGHEETQDNIMYGRNVYSLNFNDLKFKKEAYCVRLEMNRVYTNQCLRDLVNINNNYHLYVKENKINRCKKLIEKSIKHIADNSPSGWKKKEENVTASK